MMCELWTQTGLITIVAGDPDWLPAAVGVAILGVALALWLNWRRLSGQVLGTTLRIAGWMLLAACLVNPLWTSSRPKRGANVLAVVTDISRSHLVKTDSEQSRSEILKRLIEVGESNEPAGWLNRIDQDFELRRYVVSDRLRQVEQYGDLQFEGVASSVYTALDQLKQRYDGQPLAGIVLISDGNATDLPASAEQLSGIAPVYPILMRDDGNYPDAAIGSVATSQTAFDDAPVTILVQPAVLQAGSYQLQVTLLDAEGNLLETQTRPASDDTPFRFRNRPTEGGTVFYQVRASLLDPSGEEVVEETTLVNNDRLISVDRGSQPRRVLYVSGRPNWEFKFLRRAVETDPMLELVGLIRIAKKEAKFDFRGRDGERSNSLFRGFEKDEQEIAEEYDEPVMVRIGTRDDNELRGGFPETAEELFVYDAIVLDDIEAGFFLADQLTLIYDFVSRRGGGLLMLGGQESFRQGEYDRTPVGEMLPVDLSRSMDVPVGPVRMTLTRDGWLQPWIRIYDDESEEQDRLDRMPGFLTLNATGFVRLGAVVMAEVQDTSDNRWPALVTQRFGKGRSAALCIGDFWRWRLREGLDSLRDADGNQSMTNGQMRSPSIVAPGGIANEDYGQHASACRQMLRWLVSDVPRQLDISIKPDPALGVGSVRIQATVKGPDFELRENADVRFDVVDPDGRPLQIVGEPSANDPGVFEAVVAAEKAGAWRVTGTAQMVDDEGEDLDPIVAASGWASQPDQDEMKSVRINHTFLKEVADVSGGRTVSIDDIDSFVDSLPQTSVPLVEIHSWPLWHQWWVFLIAIGCFATDWTLRRRRGLP
ncbi:MAG: hypothetical protein KDA91_22525 [Planctomycetaceae bacterium]|nr:hypothetical protein [Planctomycetaceae bacterium]